MSREERARRAALAEQRRARRRKRALSIAAFVLAGALAVGGTVAYLADETEGVSNTFAPAAVRTAVSETFDGATKTNVEIKNTGDVDAYIRAAVVVTWQDKDGNVYGQAPVSSVDNPVEYDYAVKYNLTDGWLKGSDGFYYWDSPVAAGESTDVLIESCEPVVGSGPEGYYLNVEIIGSGVQADGVASSTEVGAVGKAPVEIAWGVTLDPETKTISKPAASGGEGENA